MAIESLGPMGRNTLTFLKELSQRVQQRIGKAHVYLLHRLFVAVHRRSTICVARSVVSSNIHIYVYIENHKNLNINIKYKFLI